MKKLILLVFIQFTLIILNAQVKIGAPGDPDINAVLELAGSSKGLLLPRLALTGASSPAPLSAFVAGMVIYNTANVTDVRPGYYYSDGIRWIRISNSLDTWSLSGNSATNPASQFLGTSDAVDLSIRTNNIERIRISSSGNIDIGTSSFPTPVKIKVGGSVSGPFSALLGLNPNISSTADGQTLYSFRNVPNFSASFNANGVIGTATEFTYTGNAMSLIGDYSSVVTLGANTLGSLAAAVNGNVSRRNSGALDGNFYAGYFVAETANPGSGSLNELYCIAGIAAAAGTGATSIGSLGAQNNFISNANPNGTVTTMYGIRNVLNHNANTTVSNSYGLYNSIAANAGSTFTESYGTLTNFITNSGGDITFAYGHYLSAIPSTTSITNYRGIYVGDIALTSGTRRAFEYGGSGANDPVIINYDGSVQIGNLIPVANAKLSITDGHFQSGQGTKPTIAGLTTLGTGGSASLNDATDVAGIISLNMGTGAYGIGAVAAVSFNKSYQNPPIVILTPANSNAATGIVNQRPYITTNTFGFTINFAIAATLDNTMLFNYQVIETVNN